MKAVDVRIYSTQVIRANSETAVGRKELLSLHGLCKLYNKIKIYKILNGFC